MTTRTTRVMAKGAVLRPLQPKDRPAVERLVRSVEVFTADEQRVALEVMDTYLENPGRDYTAVGAFTPRNTLAGYVCYGLTPCTAGTWDLYWIAVSGEVRGRGTKARRPTRSTRAHRDVLAPRLRPDPGVLRAARLPGRRAGPGFLRAGR
jgi:hypothetical protein